MDTVEYKYTAQPLTPGIAEELIQELFAGRIAERHKIVDSIVQTHRTRGGLDSRAKDTPRLIKKALSNLEKAGLAANPSFGQWKIATISGQGPSIEITPSESNDETLAAEPIADVVVGEGEDSVYLYYFESYRQLAILNGKQEFQCKIGRTERDPLLRVLSQSSTALPEYPKIARLYRTTDGSALETAIHAILSLRGKELKNSPGSEWFLTSLSEVDEIVKFIAEIKEKD